MDKINILGINISTLNKQLALSKIEQFLQDGKQHQIVTPNPEFLLEACKNEEFFFILNNSDLAIPDGIGLKFAALTLGKNIYRFTGADLVKDVLQIAQKKNLKVAILNWRNGLSGAEDIKNTIEKLYPNLQFTVEEVDRESTTPYYQNINVFEPQIILNTLGAPWQDKFIFKVLQKMPFVKLGIGVGGSFDFLTGKIKRAPKFFRIIGLEWLWRLIKQPWRWRRIYNAVIVFPLKFFKVTFIMSFFYRPNVVCLIFKKENGKNKILLVERQDDPGHWQLPQGGIDKDDLEIAAKREIDEEVGIKSVKIIKTYKNIFKYLVNRDHIEFWGRFRTSGYKGQKQSLAIAEYNGNDKEIKINFWDHLSWKWVDSENLVNEVHALRKPSAKIFYQKFKETIK